MDDKCFHRLPTGNEKVAMGKAKVFPNPFYYEPSPLARLAVALLQQSLPELKEGKMFGVLIVEYGGKLGYLQAYSGQLEGISDDSFVPLVFDYLQPNGYFKIQEAEITALNHEIEVLKQSDDYEKAIKKIANLKVEAQQVVAEAQQKMVIAKRLRDERRKEKAIVSEDEQREMIRESQYMKAELHRTKKRYAALLQAAEAEVEAYNRKIAELKSTRKRKSDQLQRWLFSQFTFLNAQGERSDLLSIFRNYYLLHSPKSVLATHYAAMGEQITLFPPSGTGECCEPKLLQYAFVHGMRPVEMAMFWWGEPPKTEIRQHGQFYPACNGKCKPLLTWMLKGMNVAANALEVEAKQSIDIVYEDRDLAVIVKPSGMLTVPGRSKKQSVETILRQRWNDNDTPIIVHRLDMATSGLLVVARNKEAHKHLQAQFKAKMVRKRYIALLDATVLNRVGLPSEGTISLPLCADELDRPRQMVDRNKGKTAITHYKIVGKTPLHDSYYSEAVKVELRPETGRTHQLRVHCAHSEGLACPILGDTLYGKRADRLYLHAEYLAFTHPTTGKPLSFESKLTT
ncbi:RluA family pseudouridine synthase [Prevotella pallens]|jgi:pseudouridine synthase, rluA family|uniref:RluA family pseudouridine synthase n=1 Tax=Prevotella pallens TaxID=60133 RepID=UPI001CB02010|nr:RluA family pseudouridine synthase [Prevotella pallens]MBF1450398.1 RluA family pseudouridine synthase [Prevotella pallens]MBF1478308.1 RluA family pseudouridine synthase [Prevotella pallens]